MAITPGLGNITRPSLSTERAVDEAVLLASHHSEDGTPTSREVKQSPAKARSLACVFFITNLLQKRQEHTSSVQFSHASLNETPGVDR